MGLWQAENGETLGRGGTWQEKEAVASHTTSRSPIRIARPIAAAAMNVRIWFTSFEEAALG